MDTFEGNQQDPLSLHKYLYCQADPINGVDPGGHSFLPSSLGAITIAFTLFAIDAIVISQVTVNYQRYFGLSARDKAIAIEQNNRTMAALQRIVDSNGERTFQGEQLGVGGRMGIVLPGDGAYQRAVNLFEALRNIEGYPSAFEELLTRIANGAFAPVPLPDSQTEDERADLARALLNRHQAFDRWLRRNI